MTDLLPCVEVEPRGEAKASVVWLHGLGADGHDFEPIVPYLKQPDTRFVFPNAPVRPVTINGGLIMPAWYDITGLGVDVGGELPRHVRESADQVEALLARERERGVPSSRIVLAGFSQGGAMALFTGLRHAERLAGILVLSAYEILADTRAQEEAAANRDTPVLFCHGTYDPVVPRPRGREAFAALERAGRDVRWLEYPMGHEVCDQEIADVRDWLAERLPA